MGPGMGALTNDDDGEFNSPYAAALPTDCYRAVFFTGSDTDNSTSNAADDTLTSGAALFRNNFNAYTVRGCTSSGQSGDEVACTVDACTGGCCAFTPNHANCAGDGIFCQVRRFAIRPPGANRVAIRVRARRRCATRPLIGANGPGFRGSNNQD